jgi:sarcosine oxidase
MSEARRRGIGTNTGWAITIVEQVAPGHRGSSLGGGSRILRYSQGRDRWYLRSAAKARRQWQALGAEVGVSPLVESGVVWFPHREDGWEADSLRALRDEAIPCERLAPAEAGALYPRGGLAVDLALVLLEPTGEVLRAGVAVAALVERAAGAGRACSADGQRSTRTRLR